MNWTFGIITGGKETEAVNKLIDSIEAMECINDIQYEIIVVGGKDLGRKNTKVIPFNDNVKPKAWVTRKKNTIFYEAKFENISISHDYFLYDKSWLKEFIAFGANWDCCMCRILDRDGIRFRDWITWIEDTEHPSHPLNMIWLPYSNDAMTDKMYISGGYYCIKRSFAIKFKLDENRLWGDSEDVDFSLRARKTWTYKMNPKSIVHIDKEKPCWPPRSAYFRYTDQ